MDVAFLAILGGLIARPIYGARSQRNYAFPALVWVLAAANLVEHLEWAELLSHSGAPRRVAILAIVALIIIFGGRILPLFTRNALRRARQAQGVEGPNPVREVNTIDTAAMVISALLIPLTIFVDHHPAMAVAFALAAALNLLRMRGWATRHTLRDPLLLILHLAYGWIPLAFAINAVSQYDVHLVPVSVAVHALTAGVIGSFAMAMMSRVMRGHTGRPLVAPRIISAAFVLVSAAALVRVFGPLILSTKIATVWSISSHIWGTAFLILVAVDLPKALAPRPDGKLG